MILIAESGSTKTTWSLLSETEGTKRFSSKGINPFFQDSSQIFQAINMELIPQLKIEMSSIKKLFFYGAGCTIEKSIEVKKALQKIFYSATIEVTSDMIGAAIATIGTDEGIVSILGTGSNSCLFNNGKIIEQISPLGFILGDEGSGAVLGKKLIGDVLKEQAPPKIIEAFKETYPNISPASIVQHVYKEEYPSRFLAQFTRFLKNHIETDYCKELVSSSFSEFVVRNIKNYNNHHLMQIHAVGSIAYHFQQEWIEVLQKHNLKSGKIIQAPIDGLEDFFSSKF